MMHRATLSRHRLLHPAGSAQKAEARGRRRYSAAARVRAKHAVSRLAAELHDRVAQSLWSVDAAIAFALESLPPDCEEARSHLQTGREQAERAYRSVRYTISALRDNVAFYRDVADALHSIVSSFSSQTGVTATFQPPDHDPAWPRLVKLHVLAIVQQALDNVARHARASSVLVTLEPSSRGWTLVVRDDGIGCTNDAPPTAGASGHYGQQIMRERAESFGGTLTIESIRNEGTSVTVFVPDRPAPRP